MKTRASLHPIVHPVLLQHCFPIVHIVAQAASCALYEELHAYPKPGLVSFVDSGSHTDMDAKTFVRSLFALRPFFKEVALAGANGSGFDSLQKLGVLAESRMLKATGNANTHRGAIFTLGLLGAAAGFLLGTGQSLAGDILGRVVRENWGDCILRSVPPKPCSHGTLVASRYGIAGARQEAAAGFPHVFLVGLPALSRCVSRGVDFSSAALHSFFCLMAVVPDNNLLFRGGEQGLWVTQSAARRFLEGGGVFQENWRQRALAVHREMVGRNLSPGGSADLLSATLFVYRIQTLIDLGLEARTRLNGVQDSQAPKWWAMARTRRKTKRDQYSQQVVMPHLQYPPSDPFR